MVDFDSVYDAIHNAKAIAWDTCHKIYLLMDDEQVVLMREYGYGDETAPDSLITKDQMSDAEMFETVKKWYDESCGLKFVSAVETNTADPNAGFESLIPQGAEDECEDCGDSGCAGVCNDYEDEEDEED